MNLSCATAPPAAGAYGAAVRYAGAHALGWRVLNATAAARAQLPHSGDQLNLRWSAATRDTPPMAWYSSKSAYPPFVLVTW